MGAPDRDLYPVSARVYKDLHDAIGLERMMTPPISYMLEALLAYEHGNAEVIDLHPDLTVEMYGDVLFDLAITIHCRKV